jgi:hypothetical protein
VTAAGGSRRSLREAGWQCDAPGRYVELREAARALEPGTTRAPRAEPGVDQFRWNLVTMREARNEKLASLRDPTDDQRRAWVAHMRARGVPADLTIRAPGARERTSFLVLGDPGEGDSSQYAVVAPLKSRADGIDFAFVASDVVYPAGDVNDYRRKFYLPYGDLPFPLYAIPGNHDWDDGGLFGFMFHFCGVDEPPRSVLGAVPPVLRPLWRKPAPIDDATSAARRSREEAGLVPGQPGSYFALDTGPLLLLGLDLGLCGRVDRDQGRWLADRSRSDPRPKILLTSKPVFGDGRYTPTPIEGGGTIDEVVRDPASNYVAVVSGEIHNYERYAVAVPGGRTIQYVVCGAAGAFTQGTHTIGPISIANPDPGLSPVDEADVRLYPLRADSLAFFSELYARRAERSRPFRLLLRAAGIRRPADLRIRPERAGALIEELGHAPAAREAAAPPDETERRAARVIRWLPDGHLGELYYPYWDWDEPPFFKCFLRVDATADEVRIRCFGATGCAEHDADPPLEDEFTWRRAGGWAP